MAAPEGEPGPPIAPDLAACAHFEPPPDCAGCGACCREAFDSVPVEGDDHATLLHQAELVVTHDDGWRDLRRVPSPTGTGTRCVALAGDGTSTPFCCRIYPDRPSACSELEVGSSACLFARRRVGLSPSPHS
ncbi:MAG TPA: YkgJ family cysteine cluster protein [Deltaproteobacteria bacterium]|nr:YkgJ family cysteine cluster protein [Deltaproteobacteria bacterium]